MAKRLKLAGPNRAPSLQKTDWDICALCQIPGGTLINPSSHGYATLADNLTSLLELDKVPEIIDVSKLNDGDGFQNTLSSNQAKWHKACYVLCNSTKVDRARKSVTKLNSKKAELNVSPVKQRLRSSFPISTVESDNIKQKESPQCFFCDKTHSDLHKVSTMSLDARVRQMATDMRDTKLLSKLSAGDMVALDSVYHKDCLSTFYNKHRSMADMSKSSQNNPQISPESLAFAELVSYIEEHQRVGDDTNHMFKLSDLKKLYCEHLKDFGGDPEKYVHSTRLAHKLQQFIPSLEVHNSKAGTVLTFNTITGDVLLEACHCDTDEEAVMLMRVAKLVRKDIFEKKYRFNGSLSDDLYHDLPVTLFNLVRMILGGIKPEPMERDQVQASASSISQLVIFNTVKRGRKDAAATRHNRDRETALPLYLGLLLHNKTRKRDLIDILYQQGLSVSYARVLQLSITETNRIISLYETEGFVCPTVLRDDLFTTGNLDNIDHNPSSTSSKDSFHGTAISVTQHLTNDNYGFHRQRPDVPEPEGNTKNILPLPESYTNISPTILPSNIAPPRCDNQAIPSSVIIDDDELQIQWLSSVLNNISDDEQINTALSWSAYFANLQPSVPRPPAITALLPMFRDNAHSAAMVKHGMNVIRQIINCVNPNQIPVLTVDQPLYAIAKKIQWAWPDEYGEKHYVVMMGGLHIEMNMLNLLGQWLEGSGWVSVMASANVTTEGRALNLQKGSHTTRGQWAHQVTAAALFILLTQAFQDYQSNTPLDEQMHFDQWCQQMASEHPQFKYWYVTLHMEILFLQFMRSQREAYFTLYVESLGKIIPWMFALDHYNYARWMTIHVKDLLALTETCPDIHAQFMNGSFVTQKSCHKFSCLAHDQVHEQLNAMVKGDGGVIGITENESALQRWMVGGPEVARLLNEYEAHNDTKGDHGTDNHHEQIPSVQQNFRSQVKEAVRVFNDFGNPFSDVSTELYTLDTKVLMPTEVIHSVNHAEDIGKSQYQRFIEERIDDSVSSFSDTIPKNNLPLFSTAMETTRTKPKSKIANLQTDVQLFSRMYISCQARDGDMDAFFKHENHAWPPSLASNGILHQTCKSDLLPCLESLVTCTNEAPDVDVRLVDGAALVHSLDPKASRHTLKTFQDYTDLVFLPHILRLLQDVVRLDVIWDTYRNDSLKAQTRRARGTGAHIKIEKNTSLPLNWKNFLRVDSNKDDLFRLLACSLQELPSPPGKTVISTLGENAVSTPVLDLQDLHCTHEESDTRLLYHALHAMHNGLSKMTIHATDTDVVAIAVAASHAFHTCEIWVAFGHGARMRYIPCHQIGTALGYEASQALLFVHAYTGCDTVSSFHGIGKKTAWSVWQSMPYLTPVFARLARAPCLITPEDMDHIERYTVLLYQRTSPLSCVNEARKHMFASGNRIIENIPPTQEALKQHVKRAVYQSGYIWGQCLNGTPAIPSPSSWGWEKGDDQSSWTPCWTTLPEASDACQELLRCGCKKSCKNMCKCSRANLKCTQLCFCAGQCSA